MSEYQAIIDFSFQINKFVNIDLFRRGFYQIRLNLRLPGCKQPHKIEIVRNNYVKQNSIQSDFESNETTTTTATSDGSSSTKSSDSNKTTTTTTSNNNNNNNTNDQNSNNIIAPPCVINGAAVSKTFHIVYKNEEILLQDCAAFRAHICLDSQSSQPSSSFKIVFLLQVELWFTDQESLSALIGTLECASTRNLQIHFDPRRGLHYNLPVIFDYFHLSGISLSIHGSLNAVCRPYISLGGKDNSSNTTSSSLSPWLSSSFAKNYEINEKQNSNSSSNNYDNCNNKNGIITANGDAEAAEAKRIRGIKSAQWHLRTLIILSWFSLRRKIDEYFRLLPPWQQAKYKFEQLFIEITIERFSRSTRRCYERLRKRIDEKIANFEEDEEDEGDNYDNYDGDEDGEENCQNETQNIKLTQSCDNEKDLPQIEDLLASFERDMSYLCALTTRQWDRFLSLVTHSDRINQHLAKIHHLQRIKRFAEGFFCLEHPRTQLCAAVSDRSSTLFGEISETMRKSAYFTLLPPCDIECLHLDGDSTTLPIIFEQKYEIVSSTTATHATTTSITATSSLGEINAKTNGENNRQPRSSSSILSSAKISLSSSFSSSNVSSSSSSSSPTTTNNKNHFRSLFQRFNSNISASDKSKKDELYLPCKAIEFPAAAAATASLTTPQTGDSSLQMIDFFGLYGNDLFRAGTDIETIEPNVEQVKRRIKLLNNFLHKKDIIKNYSRLSLQQYSDSREGNLSTKLAAITVNGADQPRNHRENSNNLVDMLRETMASSSSMTIHEGLAKSEKSNIREQRKNGQATEAEEEQDAEIFENSQSWPNLTAQAILRNKLYFRNGFHSNLLHRNNASHHSHYHHHHHHQHHSRSSSEQSKKKNIIFVRPSIIGSNSSNSSNRSKKLSSAKQLIKNRTTKTINEKKKSNVGANDTSEFVAPLTTSSDALISPDLSSNYATFHGTMYFPKPPKEFAMEAPPIDDEPTEEVDLKPIPSLTQSKANLSSLMISAKPITTTTTHIGAKIRLEDLNLDEQLLKAIGDLKLKNSASCQNLVTHETETKRVENNSVNQVEDICSGSKLKSGQRLSPLSQPPAPPRRQAKDDSFLQCNASGSSSSGANLSNVITLADNKLSFVELLRSDHCLICSGTINDHHRFDHSWPCMCQASKPLPKAQQPKQSKQQSKQQKQQSQNEQPALFKSRSMKIIKTKKNANDVQHTGQQLRRASVIESDLLSFVNAKEQFREMIWKKDQNLLFYSDFHTFASRIPYFQCEPDFRVFNAHKDLHLIVCVHGLDGNSADLRLVRTYLELGLPTINFDFLMSQRNQGETFDSLETLTSRLVNEIDTYVATYSLNPSKISFIGHSLGNIIIRAAISRHDFIRRWRDKLHTFLSLSGPHLGLLYNRSGLVNMGLWFFQKFKKATSLTQLSLKDCADIRQTFLYQLSTRSGLEHFRNILLCGSSQDFYVPIHSAHIELCAAALSDSSENGSAYREMANNILERLSMRSSLNVIRYDVHHALSSGNANSLIGRAAHIAVLDSELFIEKFMVVVGLKYFV